MVYCQVEVGYIKLQFSIQLTETLYFFKSVLTGKHSFLIGCLSTSKRKGENTVSGRMDIGINVVLMTCLS